VIRLRAAGEHAVLIELGDNARVRRAARGLESLDGLVDVVPAHTTVLVTSRHSIDRDALVAAVESVLEQGDDELPAREIEIPVDYAGPDLDEVARLTGLSPADVVARHCASEYVVGFLGFAPGFAYLLGGDEGLHVPRRAEPRTCVPAGSVAVAGPYSGVYPRESPGGWRILGRTAVTLFDPARAEPALLAPGDRVRFVAA
jgi:KipI family sensor histidine kinase inhibitor